MKEIKRLDWNNRYEFEIQLNRRPINPNIPNSTVRRKNEGKTYTILEQFFIYLTSIILIYCSLMLLYLSKILAFINSKVKLLTVK